MPSLYEKDFVNDVVLLTAKNRYRLSDGVMTTTTLKVEKQKKLTLYSSPEQLDVLLLLEPAALKLWIYLVMTLGKGRYSIKIKRKQFMTTANINSLTTIRNAVAQLVRYDLIRLEGKDIAHINPLYICSGNRINLFKDSVNITADFT